MHALPPSFFAAGELLRRRIDPAPALPLPPWFATELVRRIEAAAPEPLKLDDDDLAKLASWLGTYRRPRVRASLLMDQGRAGGAYREQIDKLEERVRHLRTVADYNARLRAAGPAAATATKPKTKTAPERRTRRPRFDLTRREQFVWEFHKEGRATFEQIAVRLSEDFPKADGKPHTKQAAERLYRSAEAVMKRRRERAVPDLAIRPSA